MAGRRVGARARAARVIVCAGLGAALAAIVWGCAFTRRDVTPQPGRPQTGVASWYGPGFHGRATSSGEIYDQHGLTAAHRTLPLGTRTRVTNLDSGRAVIVRVNDRGPFVKNRAIDLSYAAAHVIGMIGPGTAPVRIEVVERPPGDWTRVVYTVQIASFREEEKARALRAELAPRYTDVYISPMPVRVDRFYRVRVGPYAQRQIAELRAREMTQLGFTAIVTEEPRL